MNTIKPRQKHKTTLVYRDVTHSCDHTVRYEFKAPKTQAEYQSANATLKAMAEDPCFTCQEAGVE